jgi:hypothetical protein
MKKKAQETTRHPDCARRTRAAVARTRSSNDDSRGSSLRYVFILTLLTIFYSSTTRTERERESQVHNKHEHTATTTTVAAAIG